MGLAFPHQPNSLEMHPGDCVYQSFSLLHRTSWHGHAHNLFNHLPVEGHLVVSCLGSCCELCRHLGLHPVSFWPPYMDSSGISLMADDTEHFFHVYLNILFTERSLHVFCPLSGWIVCFENLLCAPFVQCVVFVIFSPHLWLVFSASLQGL